MQQTTTSPEQTILLAKDFAPKLKGGDILALHGDLGTGKTTFVKGLAKALGIKDEITSPTFTLMNHYEINSPKPVTQSLVHIDTYRLQNEQELIDIGIEDYLGKPETICVIEWPEKIQGLLKGRKIKSVSFEHISESERKIVIESSS